MAGNLSMADSLSIPGTPRISRGRIQKIVRDGGQESLNHSFAGPEGEVQRRLTVEHWVRNGKSGYAVSVQRDEEQINMPVQSEQFLYAAEFLRNLSLQQAWVEGLERSVE